MTTKIDYKKTLGKIYRPGKKPTIIDIPPMNYLMLDGSGPPGSEEYQNIVGTLYGLAYPIRFSIKASDDIAYTVMPLEGLWWAEDMSVFTKDNREDWLWTMMIMQPELVTQELAKKMIANKREEEDTPYLEQVRFESYAAGSVVQMMHIGPYADEGPNIAWMHEYAAEQGYTLTGKHQEIYLSDPRRAAPEKMKTILRQPIKKQ